MITLIIENRIVDLSKSIGLYLNKTFENLQKPVDYYSDFSKTITLPMTPNNNEIFSHFNRHDSLVTNISIDPRKKLSFILLYNGNMLMNGSARLVNANTIYTDNKYEIELYSSFGMVINELKQLTFNKFEDKDEKYIINSPFSEELKVDYSLVKRSFEQEGHNLDGEDILDYIKFLPSYQGKYDSFESDKFQLLQTGDYFDLGKERDEHYVREFRSYYQQPAIWVDKLWSMTKNKIEEITDYKVILDWSWFNTKNPYYTDLVYTCPSLFTKDNNFTEISNNISASITYNNNVSTMSNLSSHHKKKLWFRSNETELYNQNTGVFNEKRKGCTQLNTDSNLFLLVHHPNNGYESNHCRIRNDNPCFVRYQAVNTLTNQVIEGASITYMLYSGSTNYTNTSVYDEKIDVGTTFSMRPPFNDAYPEGYGLNDGYWFKADLNLRLTIKENVPYYITMDSWWANNSKAFEIAVFARTPHWDWLWQDFFWSSSYHDTTEGYSVIDDLQSAEVKTIDYLRSNSYVSMYRVFPKDITLCDVILNYSKMFGLLWDIDDEEKTITVLNRNKFFKNYKIVDWSDKLDRSRDFKLSPINFDKRYVEFNVDDGNGLRYELYASKYKVGYGSKKLDTDYEFNSETEKMFNGIKPSMISQKSQFSREDNTENPDGANFKGYNFKRYPNEHYIENDNEGSNAGNSGSFYFVNGTMNPDKQLGILDNNGRGCVVISDDTDLMQLKESYCWNLTGDNCTITNKLPDVNTISNGGFSVHFESPKEYYFKQEKKNVKYVYNLFWKDFIDERYSVQNKKLTGYFFISPSDYYSISFRDFVKIDNVLYHINKVVDYDFDSNSPTLVELVQVWNIDAYTKGQHQFPVLFTNPKCIMFTDLNDVNIEVFSSSEWRISRLPNWVTARKDGENNLILSPLSSTIRTRMDVVTLINSENVTYNLAVAQKAVSSELHLERVSRTIVANGESFDLRLHSIPESVRVSSKPSWVDVIFSSSTLTLGFNTICRIVAQKNNSTFVRRGNIVFDNGFKTATFAISQLGKKTVLEQNDDTILVVDIDRDFDFTITTPDEFDLNTFSITRGTVVKPTNKINNVQLIGRPIMNKDVIDNTPENVSSGGQMRIVKKDGQVIMKNYNIGLVENNYNIIINNIGGVLKVNGNDYLGSFVDFAKSGEELTIEFIPTDGVFIEWSDGVNNNPRTIVVGEDTEITPIVNVTPTEEYFTFDNGETAKFDNNIKIEI